jgi:hypothetical protein
MSARERRPSLADAVALACKEQADLLGRPLTDAEHGCVRAGFHGGMLHQMERADGELTEAGAIRMLRALYGKGERGAVPGVYGPGQGSATVRFIGAWQGSCTRCRKNPGADRVHNHTATGTVTHSHLCRDCYLYVEGLAPEPGQGHAETR